MSRLAVGLATLSYPFLVYAYIESHPGMVVALLGVLGGLRLAVAGKLDRGSLLALLGLAAFCAVAWWVGTRFAVVKLYPVCVSMAAAAYGLWTLAHPPSAAERFAPLWAPNEQLDERAKAYMRRVTAVWIAFFIGNGSVAAYTTAWTSTGVWAIYNGFVSYVLMGLLFGGEHLFRIWRRRRHPASTG